LIETLGNWIIDEFLVAGGQLENIFTAFHAGLCAGAFVWAVLVDIIGKLSTSPVHRSKAYLTH
jgi:hypothetical protein